jgi:DNA invertase Pin-like site-specific DNA recombinase
MSDSSAKPPKVVALYARVSTTDQTVDNQLLALRAFATARGWTVTEFVDHAQSGAKEKRPALDAVLAAARARKVDVVACVKLDRLARSVHHLVAMVREFEDPLPGGR